MINVLRAIKKKKAGKEREGRRKGVKEKRREGREGKEKGKGREGKGSEARGEKKKKQRKGKRREKTEFSYIVILLFEFCKLQFVLCNLWFAYKINF